MNYGQLGQIATVIAILALVFAWVKSVKHAVQAEIEADEQAPLKLTRSVRYDRNLYTETAFSDDYERPILPPAA